MIQERKNVVLPPATTPEIENIVDILAQTVATVGTTREAREVDLIQDKNAQRDLAPDHTIVIGGEDLTREIEEIIGAQTVPSLSNSDKYTRVK